MYLPLAIAYVYHHLQIDGASVVLDSSALKIVLFIQDMPGFLLFWFQLDLSQNFGAFLAAGMDSFQGAVA